MALKTVKTGLVTLLYADASEQYIFHKSTLVEKVIKHLEA